MNEPSTEAQIQAAATLARGDALAKILRVVIMTGLPVLTGLTSWGAAKLDTKEDIAGLRLSIDRLVTQQAEMTERMDVIVSDTPAQLNGIRRAVVVASGAALAYETDKVHKIKLDAGNALGDKYDRKVKELVPPALALEALVNNASLPRAPR